MSSQKCDLAPGEQVQDRWHRTWCLQLQEPAIILCQQSWLIFDVLHP